MVLWVLSLEILRAPPNLVATVKLGSHFVYFKDGKELGLGLYNHTILHEVSFFP